jgi:MSHA biogenesis protein MshN
MGGGAMSLINKMLQDLDARGGQPGVEGMAGDLKPVLPPERRAPWMRIALVGLAAALLGGGGYAAWLAWRIKNTVAVEIPVAQAPAAGASTQMVVTPLPRPEDAADAPAPAVEPAPATPAAPEPAVTPAPEPAQPKAEEPAPAPPQQAAAKPERKREERRAVARAVPARAEAGAKPAAAAASGRTETTAQRAENGYRRALASLEDGRVSEAVGHLQAALKADPRHEASRQTLVSLLVEAKRPDEAMRQLQTALALDPRQPAMAMLLARLQIERGGPAIETLQRTLPYAAGNGDYHAFLAGVLQRDGRHREAAEHYQAALRGAPQNGVWWMGLGISLQAEKRNPEALDAFQKAQVSGTLTPELQAFVERKLKQVGR